MNGVISEEELRQEWVELNESLRADRTHSITKIGKHQVIPADGHDIYSLPGLLADWQIDELCHTRTMIDPYFPHQIKDNGVISYGLSSYGYDARVASEFKIFTNVNSVVVDPKNFSEESFVEREGDHCIIPPHSFMLARTVERFRIPRDTLILCIGKSTYARCGIIVNVTPLEPEWEGFVTLEFSNTTPLPAKIYANEGACQFMFIRGAAPCKVSYSDRKGKYQNQVGVTLPKIVK